MTNEEKARRLANYFAGETDYKESAAYSAALEAMQWKDEQHAQEKQQWIDKACEFIEGNISEYYNSHYNDFDEMNFINDFKNAMKGE